MAKYIEVEVLADKVADELNKQDKAGYDYVETISERHVPRTEPDAHGMSYGGETYKKLLFRRRLRLGAFGYY